MDMRFPRLLVEAKHGCGLPSQSISGDIDLEEEM